MSSSTVARRLAAGRDLSDRSSTIAVKAYAKRRIPAQILNGLVAVIDACIVLLSGLAAAKIAHTGDRQIVGLVALLGTLLTVNLTHVQGGYRLESISRVRASLAIAISSLGASFATLFILAFVTDVPEQDKEIWLPAWLLGSCALAIAWRLALGNRVDNWRRNGRLGENIAILGATHIAQRLLYSLASTQERRGRVVGIFDERKTRLAGHCGGHKILGGIDDLIWEIRANHIDVVVLALPLSAERRINEILARLSCVAVDIRLCPDHFGMQLGQFEVTHLGSTSLLCAQDRPLRHWRHIAKIIEDRILAALILTLIAPVMATIALLIKIDSPGPVLFRQSRWGYNNQLFQMLKFRTMYHAMADRDGDVLVTRDDSRVTPLGRFLRRTSLDELPQFFNVLMGDMSIVGPRPHALAVKAGGLMYQDAVRNYDSRHRMKPGITGWAQINGWRGETKTVEQIVRRVEHDLYYVDNWSIYLDLRIIAMTVLKGFTSPLAY